MTLLELLVVITIIAIMAALTVPALVGITQGRDMKRAVSDMASVIEMARSEAMATSTWVWIGVADTSSSSQNELTVVTVSSCDGTTNTASNNLTRIAPPMRLRNIKILGDPTGRASNSFPLKGGSASFQSVVSGRMLNFNNMVLSFSPRGEATLQYGRLDPWIEVGLREVRGTTEQTNKTAAILVSGMSGQQIVFY